MPLALAIAFGSWSGQKIYYSVIVDDVEDILEQLLFTSVKCAKENQPLVAKFIFKGQLAFSCL